MKTKVLIIIFVIVAIAITVGGIYFFRKKDKAQQEPQTKTQQEPQPETPTLKILPLIQIKDMEVVKRPVTGRFAEVLSKRF